MRRVAFEALREGAICVIGVAGAAGSGALRCIPKNTTVGGTPNFSGSWSCHGVVYSLPG